MQFIRSVKNLGVGLLFAALVFPGVALAQHLIAPEAAEPEVEIEEVHNVDRLHVLSSVTWWSLDNRGYHPAVLVKIQNISGHDLTGKQMQFQARFIDTRTGATTVGKSESRHAFPKNKLIYILLKGKDAYDLSNNIDEWPPFECKLMCRVGDVGHEGTQTLLVSKVELVAMTDDDALYKINRMADLPPVEPPAPVKEEVPVVKRHVLPKPPAKAATSKAKAKKKT
ncbi:MAG: hypothetical protein K2Y22_17670 [Candidatus Obscuribacterales bacterium]|nr:hypothetical protein [Candidatus Obscuribacterales bacterium]